MITDRMEMGCLRLRPLVVFAVLLCAIIGGAAADTASPKQTYNVVLSYDVFLGGILAGTVDLNVARIGQDYDISSVSRSHGLLDFLIELRRQNGVSGRIEADRTYPNSYKTTGQWAGNNRSVQITYTGGAGGAEANEPKNDVSFIAHPNAEDDEREVVPVTYLPGTKDPFSAMFEAVLRNEMAGSCAGSVKVFDGRRRYDLQAQSVGKVDARAMANRDRIISILPGFVNICRITQNLIAGASKKKWLPRLARPKWTDIWLAKVRTELPALPVRLEADAGMGAMVARLVAIGGRRHLPGKGPNGRGPNGQTMDGQGNAEGAEDMLETILGNGQN